MGVTDYITGIEVKDFPEEENVQLLARWFVSLGYKKEQIQTHPQYRIKKAKRSKKRQIPIDLAVFQDEKREDDNILFIAECKRSQIQGGEYDGLLQLKRYMKQCDAPIGIWFNGIDMDFILQSKDIGEKLKSSISNDPSPLAFNFGHYVGLRRQQLDNESGKKYEYSIRKVSKRTGIEPTYLSKIERGTVPPPSDEVIVALAKELKENPDSLLIKAGRIPASIKSAILLRPKVMAGLIEALADKPDEVLKNIIENSQTIRDGDW